MPKTWGLTYKNNFGKSFHGTAADNYLVYNKCHGLPAYTMIVIAGTSLVWLGGIAGYQKIKQHCFKNISVQDASVPSDSGAVPNI